MPVLKLLHLSDIHLGSGFVHGKINPETGLNTRFEDFVTALQTCIDRALAEPVDLVLFGGDAFPDATPAPYIQEAFAQQFRRLADAAIPAVLLVGNHDQHTQGQGGASLGLYRTLGVPGVVVGDRLSTHPITTRNGPIQVVTLPWLTRSVLLTRPETEGLSMAEVSGQLLDRLRIALEGEIRQLDPAIPTVLLAHAMLDTAMYGAERFLAVGKGFTLPLSLLTRDCFDYVALGHVHKYQVLCDRPPVVYPGSIERVDFSEEKEEKGFVLVALERGQATVVFQPLSVRPFKTITLNISQAEDPQDALLKGLANHAIVDAVVRLVYQLRSDQVIDDRCLHEALSVAHSYTIQPELVSQLATPRLPELSADRSLNPLEALKTYLSYREDLRELEADLLQAAQGLLADEAWEASEIGASAVSEVAGGYEVEVPVSPEHTQLRLL